MQDELVPVFTAPSIDDAERLADKLAEAGIEAFVDTTEAPMYGMARGPGSRVVEVRSLVREHAKQIVNRYRQRWHDELPEAGRPASEPNWERPARRRPSRDEAHGGLDHFTESLHGRRDPVPPELRALHDASGRSATRRAGLAAMREGEPVDLDELPPDAWL